MIKETNPGSYALITWNSDFGNVEPRFRACFFLFVVQDRGFLKGCRPIVGTNAHLSECFKGILLSFL